MPETLTLGSRGEEIRRLQVNLNAAIGKRYGLLNPDGKFGPLTKTAVEHFQSAFKLKSVDGIVGPETRGALATRVLIIQGTMARDMAPPPPAPPSPGPKPSPSPPPSSPPSQPPAKPSPFLLQLMPSFGVTPPPFLSSSPGPTSSTVVAGQLAMGLVYRTASEGPHWEFGGFFQPSFNSTNSSTDPRYTLQVQGNVAYADPWAAGRFHTQLFGQVVLIQNSFPKSTVAGLMFGGQVSADIIADRWNLFFQGAAAGTWDLHDESGNQAGQLLFGPQLTLGTTIQWGF
jgi:hypothetical protein